MLKTNDPIATRALGALLALCVLACSDKDDGISTSAGPGAGGAPGASGATAGTGGANGNASPGGTTGTSSSTDNANAAGPITPIAIDQCGATNPAGLSATQVAQLKAGGQASAPRLLYPYDGTVFPRGLTAPMLMWEGGADAVYVHLKGANFEYHGCLRPSAAGQLQLPQDVWNTAGQQTGGRNDPLTVELTSMSGQTIAGPARQRWVIAQATLKGSIYYNSYNSQLAGGGIVQSGAILRLRPGQPAELFERSGSCTGCHSLSANGERMVAMELGLGGLGGLLGGSSGSNPLDAIGSLLGGTGGAGGGIAGTISSGPVYALTPDTAPNAAPARSATSTSFAGLTPDGKFYLSSAATVAAGPQLQGGFGVGTGESFLIETDTGNVVADTGIPTTAMMPTFSADGTLLTFSDATQGGRAIVVMDFDMKTRKAKNARTVVSDSRFLGWPFVLPDNRAVVFSITDASNFSGGGVGISPIVPRGPTGDLGIVDLATKKVSLLAKAVGFANEADANAGKTYLPFGAEELHQHYYPTVSPVASGGYFWIFFDSVRHYGSKGSRRQLWGAAIAIQSRSELSTGAYDGDPSFPAFYLAGQELDVANHRAFTALDPCRKDGAKCESGIDCCGGFCSNGMCGRDMHRCSQTNEACTMKSDCCRAQDECIGGYCGVVLE